MTSPSTDSLPNSLSEIVQKFKRHSDPKRRYEQLLWYAKQLEELSEIHRTAENQVQGCTSRVFIMASLQDGLIYYKGYSDAQLVKGLVALLIKGLNGLTSEQIISISPDFIEETGLKVSLTPSRANGFYNILQLMKKQAFQLS
jgi:cysteine desulfuration protein SufE